MEQSSRKFQQLSGSVPTRVGEKQDKAERIIDFLRRIHPYKTAENVAAETGCSVESIARMIERRSAPDVVNFSRLIGTYGFPFLVAVFPCRPQWLSDAYQREQLAELEAEQARIQSKIAALRANQ